MNGPGLLMVLIVLIVLTPAILAALWRLQRGKSRKEPGPPEPAVDSRLSFLAGMAFFCGLFAAFGIIAAGILSFCARYGDLTGGIGAPRQALLLAERIVLYSTLVPAVGAIAFWIGARAAVRGSDGRVRGRALYRTGAVLAVLTACLALGTKTSFAELLESGAGLRAFRWTTRGHPPRPERGFLGLEVEQAGSLPGVRVKALTDGGPAARGGLQLGDVITTVDGHSVLGRDFGQMIGSRAPETTVTLALLRRDEALSLPVTLGPPPIASLVDLLNQQSFDDDREAVLRVASAYRRFSTADLIRVCATFRFDGGRMEAIRLALPGLTDPENSHQLLGALRFSDSKQTVSGWLERSKR